MGLFTFLTHSISRLPGSFRTRTNTRGHTGHTNAKDKTMDFESPSLLKKMKEKCVTITTEKSVGA